MIPSEASTSHETVRVWIQVPRVNVKNKNKKAASKPIGEQAEKGCLGLDAPLF